MSIHVYPDLKINFDSKNGRRRSFSYETKAIKIVYHNKENVFVVPYPEKKGYYYENPCLSQLKDELRF